jgi:hypothetical protein
MKERRRLTISREHGILLVKHKGHMIHRMPRRMKRHQRRPLDLKHLSIAHLQLALFHIRIALVYLDARKHLHQIFNSADMVMVPVGDERGLDAGLFRGEDGFERLRPACAAFAGVDEETLCAAADEVCVRAWERVSIRDSSSMPSEPRSNVFFLTL